MCFNHKYPQAKPLTQETIKEFKEQGYEELIVELDDELYNSEDLYYCENHKECGYMTADYNDMQDGLCETCMENHLEYEDYIEDVKWTYRHSVL